LSQSRYIDMILKRFGFENCYTVSTPLEPGSKLVSNPTNTDTEDEGLYRSILGSIMYLILSLKRLLYYISKTRDHGLHFGPFTTTDQATPYIFSDAEWAGDKDN
ncbi:hypothetical protein B9Z19DRAFT_984537, partial [Tuber borchii]